MNKNHTFALALQNVGIAFRQNAQVAELVDALDSKSSSSECGFDSRPGYKRVENE